MVRLKPRSTTSPLNYSWNTTSLPNGSHTIYSKAYDAAGNVGTSTTITVKVSGASTQLVFNGGFELGSLAYWSVSGVDFPAVVTTQAHTGAYSVRLGVSSGQEPTGNSSLYEVVSIPSTATTATVTFWYWPATADTITSDWQEAQVQSAFGVTLAQIMKVCSNTQTWTQVTYNLLPYKGQTIRIFFNVHEDGDPYGAETAMYLDDVTVVTN